MKVGGQATAKKAKGRPRSLVWFQLAGLLLVVLLPVVLLDPLGMFGNVTERWRADPFAHVEPGISWRWWLHALPEQVVQEMPVPLARRSRLVPRESLASHELPIASGPLTITTDQDALVEVADIHLFQNGAGWILGTDGRLYRKQGGAGAEGGWQAQEIAVQSERLPVQQEPELRVVERSENWRIDSADWADFSPDGTLVAVLNRSAEAVDVFQSGSSERYFNHAEDTGRVVGNPQFDRAGRRLLILTDRMLYIGELEPGTILEVPAKGKSPYTAAAFAPGDRIVTFAEDTGVILLEADTGVTLGGFLGPDEPIQRFVISPNGRTIAALTENGAVNFYDLPSESFLGQYGSKVPVVDLTFDSTGDLLVMANQTGTLLMTNFAGLDVDLQKKTQSVLSVSELGTFDNVLHLSGPNDLAIVRQGGTVVFWDFRQGAGEALFAFAGAETATMSSGGDLVATLTVDGEFEVLDRSGQTYSGVVGRLDPTASLQFSQDGKQLLAYSEGSAPQVWDVRFGLPTADPAAATFAFEDTINGMYFSDSATGSLVTSTGLALGTRDGGAVWRQSDTGAGERPLNGVFVARDRRSGWVVGDDGFMARTEDGGATWKQLDTNTSWDLLAVHFASSGGRGLVVGRRGTALAATGNGDALTEIDLLSNADLWSAHLLPNGVGWIFGESAADTGSGWRTTDHGAAWEVIDYSELPSPILLLIAVPVLGFAIMLFLRRPQNEPEVVEGVAPVGMSDRPIGWEDADPLQFKPIARGISYFLRNEKTEPPLTIAFNGPWGTGKSSLMNLVTEDLRQYGCRPVWFNAWHHQKEEHLLAALLENIRKQAVPRLWQKHGLIFRARLFLMRSKGDFKVIGAVVAILIAAGLVFELALEGDNVKLAADWTVEQVLGGTDGADQQEPSKKAADTGKDETGLKSDGAWHEIALGKLREVLGERGGVIGSTVLAVLSFFVWAGLRLRILPSDPAKLMAVLSRRVRVKDLREQLSFRHTFAGEFAEVCHALRWGSSPGLVIVIDDLDRCRPENMLEVLEAVNFLSSVGQCFIILGMARKQVETCVAVMFKDFILDDFSDMEQAGLTTGQEGEHREKDDSLKSSVVSEVLELRTDAQKTHPNGGDQVKGNGAANADAAPEEEAETVQLSDPNRLFAKRYLEKLVNIEIDVPRGDAGHAVALLDQGEADELSIGRRRWRMRVHAALGFANLLVVGAILGVVLTLFEPGYEESGAQPAATTEQPGSQTTQSGAPSTDGSAGQDTQGPVRAGAGESPQVDIQSVGQRFTITPVSASDAGARRHLLWWVPSGLIILLVALLWLRRRFEPAGRVIQDSTRYADALRLWFPLIYFANPTPRAIKRFENRTRFLAMRLRMIKTEPDWIDTLRDRVTGLARQIWSGGKPEDDGADKKTTKPDSQELSDDMLVALSAVEAFTHRVIANGQVDAARSSITSALEQAKSAAHGNGSADYAKSLDKLKSHISSTTGWRPDQTELDIYHELCGQIRA